MGQQHCCQNEQYPHEIVINFNVVFLQQKNTEVPEPIETSAPSRIKENQFNENLIFTRQSQDQANGQYVTEDPLVTQAVYQRLEALRPLTDQEFHFKDRGVDEQKYFRFKNTGIVYVGEWKNGVPAGFGKNYYPNGGIYEGGFADGIPHHFGRFVMPNGDYYQGDVKYGRANGFGIYENYQSSYKGEFKDNMRHGKGEEKGEGVYFKGEFEYGERKEGILKYNKNVYEGTFLDGIYHGNGKLTTSEGQYTGGFKEGRQHGFGEFKWDNGSTFRGEYNMGNREGEGEYFNAKSASISKGQWKGGKLNGEGIYIQSRGSKHKCIWKEGKISAIIE